MSDSRHVLPITVGLRSPFVMAGIEPVAAGVDTPALRDEEDWPIIPADHLKGLLKQACDTLADAAPAALGGLSIADLFGQESKAEIENKKRAKAGEPPQPQDRGAYEPVRAELLFGDLAAKQMILPDNNRACIKAWRGEIPGGGAELARIEIDDETGTVARGMLQVVELAAPLAAIALFEGEAVFHGSDQEANSVGALLDKALRIVPYFGGLRSAGFGEHEPEHSSVGPKSSTALLPTVAPPVPARLICEATFDRPFLAAAEREADNLCVGAQVVPGGAIKGAIADMLRRAGHDPVQAGQPHHDVLDDVLEKMRVSHAFPVAKNGALGCRALPLSAMFDGKSYECAFDTPTPGLMCGRCADFQPDWKGADRDRFATAVGRPRIGTRAMPRGHTVINAETGVATDQLLFVEVARGAMTGRDGKDFDGKQVYRFEVDFNGADVDARLKSAAADVVAILNGGLDAFGKTRARMAISVTAGSDELPSKIDGKTDGGKMRWRVLLETPGVLADPDSDDAPEEPVNDQLDRYFDKIVPGARLAAIYAQRRLVGGYQVQRHRASGANYRPYSLFVEGSCFLVEADASVAAAVGNKLAELTRTGLPVMQWAAGPRLEEVTLARWRDCPFLPQNGFGAISVEDEVFDCIARASAPAGGGQE